MLKKLGALTILLMLFLVSFTVVEATCTQPSVRSCNSECAHLPSYPTFEKEACITACVADDQADWANYYDCLDSESEQADEDQAAAEAEAAEQAAADAAAAAQKAAEDATQQELEDQLAEEQRQAEQDAADAATKVQEEAAAKVGRTDSIYGNVEIRQPDGTYKPLGNGADFKEGDIIRTRNDGSVALVFHDGSEVNLGPNSVFIVEKMSNEDRSFTLSKGRIWAYIQKTFGNRFAVRTPTAVHAVRGTEFIVEYDEASETSILYLFEGEIEYTTDSGEEIVYAGETVVTTSEGSEHFELTQDQEEWYNIIDATIYTPEVESPETIVEAELADTGESSGSGIIVFFVLLALGIGGVVFFKKRKKSKHKK